LGVGIQVRVVKKGVRVVVIQSDGSDFAFFSAFVKMGHMLDKGFVGRRKSHICRRHS